MSNKCKILKTKTQSTHYQHGACYDSDEVSLVGLKK